jgi:beta-phosphoglucomutase-like phosphatase (HAD superfamily)
MGRLDRSARHTFSALLGVVVAQGRSNAETFQYFRPGFDLEAERIKREEAGVGEQIDDHDLYPDVRPALTELRSRGVWVGVAGNQTRRTAQLLRRLDLPVDGIATSGDWGWPNRTRRSSNRWLASRPVSRLRSRTSGTTATTT